MNNEIEAQFLDINKDEIRKKLRKAGANLEKPEVLMRRVVFDTGPHSFARVRDEGDKIVMTFKNVADDHSILGTKEVALILFHFIHRSDFLQHHSSPLGIAWQLVAHVTCGRRGKDS